MFFSQTLTRKSSNENQTCCKSVFPYFIRKSARQQNKPNKNQVKCKEYNGVHTYRPVSGGFTLSWGELADPDRLCWLRKASRARRRLSLSISSASSILRWAVTLQEEKQEWAPCYTRRQSFFFLYPCESRARMMNDPEPRRVLLTMRHGPLQEICLFSPLLEIQSQWNICSGIRHHQCLSDRDPANSHSRFWSISGFI